jgi:hypothetical protein
MEHVFTVDLRGVELYGVPADAVAMMLFLSNATFHRACRDGNPHTAVRFLREQDLRRGPYRGALPRRSLYRWSRRFSLVPVAVPGDVFDVPELDLPADDPLVVLYHAIGRAPARLGGCPIGLREPEVAEAWAVRSPRHVSESSRTLVHTPRHAGENSRTLVHPSRRASEPRASGPFLMQFQRGFADVDLGRRGVMYVSERSAYVPLR